jgi:hypothetical protein
VDSRSQLIRHGRQDSGPRPQLGNGPVC